MVSDGGEGAADAEEVDSLGSRETEDAEVLAKCSLHSASAASGSLVL